MQRLSLTICARTTPANHVRLKKADGLAGNGKWLEWVWRGSESLGNQADIF
eukprot:SAG11_NODE_8468_length_1012_cov_0.599124_1_plen_50_part_10